MLERGEAVLVDVGLPPESAGAIQGMVRWPLSAIHHGGSIDDVPPELQGRKLLLICPAGGLSARAALKLRGIGVNEAYSVRGGLQDWNSAVSTCPMGIVLRGTAESDAGITAFRPSPVYEQWILVLTFFGVKFVYTLLSLAIVIALWRRTEADLAALRRALICFFVGEAMCFINVTAFLERSLLLEYLHSTGMGLSIAFSVYALLEGVDLRLIHYSGDARCAALGLCRTCIKHANVGCGLRRLFLMLVPATAVVAAIPLCSALRATTYNTRVFGILHTYRHPLLQQWYELRFLPIVAILLLTACFLVLWLVERHPVGLSKILFAAAIGATGFSWFRLILVASFVRNQVWFVAWEEITELLFVGMAGGILIAFRGLLAERPAPPAISETH